MSEYLEPGQNPYESFEQFVNFQLAGQEGYLEALDILEARIAEQEYEKAQRQATIELLTAHREFEAFCSKQETPGIGQRIVKGLRSVLTPRPIVIREGMSEHGNRALKRNNLNPYEGLPEQSKSHLG